MGDTLRSGIHRCAAWAGALGMLLAFIMGVPLTLGIALAEPSCPEQSNIVSGEIPDNLNVADIEGAVKEVRQKKCLDIYVRVMDGLPGKVTVRQWWEGARKNAAEPWYDESTEDVKADAAVIVVILGPFKQSGVFGTTEAAGAVIGYGDGYDQYGYDIGVLAEHLSAEVNRSFVFKNSDYEPKLISTIQDLGKLGGSPVIGVEWLFLLIPAGLALFAFLVDSGLSWWERRSVKTTITSTPVAPTPPKRPDYSKRVEAVQEALRVLDVEWLEYTRNVEEYFLLKPVLRDQSCAPVKRYNDALFDLREAVNGLPRRHPPVDKVMRAERLADAAMQAWSEANDYAAKVGIDDRTPVERAALRRLHGLVSQLVDPATPRAMWDSLIHGIERESDKLVTVPVTMQTVARFPSVEALKVPALEPADRSPVGAA